MKTLITSATLLIPTIASAHSTLGFHLHAQEPESMTTLIVLATVVFGAVGALMAFGREKMVKMMND